MRPLSRSQFFSLARMLFGLWLIQHFFFLIPYGSELYSSSGMKVAGGALYLKETLSFLRTENGITTLLYLSLTAAILFTFKIKRRICSLFLFFSWIFLFHQDLLSYNPGLPYIGWMLLALSLIPDTEERFFWKKNELQTFFFPPVLFWGLWLVVALGYTASGLHKFFFSPLWRNGDALLYVFDYPATRSETLAALYMSLPLLIQKVVNWSVILIEGLFFVALIHSGSRKMFWILNTLMHVGILITLKFASLSVIMLIIHVFMIEENWFSFGGISKLRSDSKK